MDAKFEHGLALVRQGLAILEKSSKGEPVGSMVMSPRVAKLGRIAHLHLKALEDGGGRLSLGQSREIRRHQLGPKGGRRRTGAGRRTAARSCTARPPPARGPGTPTLSARPAMARR